MDGLITALFEKLAEIRERLLAILAEDKKQFDTKVEHFETNMAEREKEHKQKLEEMLKIVENNNNGSWAKDFTAQDGDDTDSEEILESQDECKGLFPTL